MTGCLHSPGSVATRAGGLPPPLGNHCNPANERGCYSGFSSTGEIHSGKTTRDSARLKSSSPVIPRHYLYSRQTIFGVQIDTETSCNNPAAPGQAATGCDPNAGGVQRRTRLPSLSSRSEHSGGGGSNKNQWVWGKVEWGDRWEERGLVRATGQWGGPQGMWVYVYFFWRKRLILDAQEPVEQLG